jgi:predicted PurR-regulated permease PerM
VRKLKTLSIILVGVLLMLVVANKIYPIVKAEESYSGNNIEPGVSDLLSTLNAWVTILSIFLTIALAGVGFMSFVQYRQGKTITDNLVSEYERKLADLETKYKLAGLRQPPEIVEDAKKEIRKEYDPLFDELRTRLQRIYDDSIGKNDQVYKEITDQKISNLKEILEIKQKIESITSAMRENRKEDCIQQK